MCEVLRGGGGSWVITSLLGQFSLYEVSVQLRNIYLPWGGMVSIGRPRDRVSNSQRASQVQLLILL